MRKFFALLSALSLLIVSFAGCNQTSEIDVWDGSIAEAFAGGDGSEKKPYIINKASQLALLAKEVNSGTDYNGKYISLECNLDLNGSRLVTETNLLMEFSTATIIRFSTSK